MAAVRQTPARRPHAPTRGCLVKPSRVDSKHCDDGDAHSGVDTYRKGGAQPRRRSVTRRVNGGGLRVVQRRKPAPRCERVVEEGRGGLTVRASGEGVQP